MHSAQCTFCAQSQSVGSGPGQCVGSQSVGSHTLRRSTALLNWSRLKLGQDWRCEHRLNTQTRYLTRLLLRQNIWEDSDKIFGKNGSVPPEANAGVNNGGKMPTAGEVGRSVDESYRRKKTEQLHHLGCFSKTGEV